MPLLRQLVRWLSIAARAEPDPPEEGHVPGTVWTIGSRFDKESDSNQILLPSERSLRLCLPVTHSL